MDSAAAEGNLKENLAPEVEETRISGNKSSVDQTEDEVEFCSQVS